MNAIQLNFNQKQESISISAISNHFFELVLKIKEMRMCKSF